MKNLIFLSDTIIIDGEWQNVGQDAGEEGAAQTEEEGTAQTETAAQTTASGAAPNEPAAPSSGLNYMMLASILGSFLIFYFLAIRPQKRKEKERKEAIDAIQVGDSVLLTSGMYGKVVDAYDSVFVVELGMNKTIVVPVNRSEIVTKAEPSLTVKPKE